MHASICGVFCIDDRENGAGKASEKDGFMRQVHPGTE